ncbi:serine threonine-protein kinase hal4 [Pochonia chlamydosporia 170]|uniref:non-specific serine/threonine protein kinase n=1 Tax=Pochonia chlamydosporia 170 TaxID=1380566 RepID=A0A179F6Y2_METCM|nr:serine threonine-protein kinase hal4 [Pochonia chlamydosporia 170]OAQ60913.1 serine threonine-protein kinase hal4 [Pochonia chlamydosporia 170]
MPQRRFVMQSTSQGGHEHHLKPKQLGANIIRAWKKLVPGKMMAMATEMEQRPNLFVELVEKYGKCKEVVGSGASGIVYISHKKMTTRTTEQLFAVKELRQRPVEPTDAYAHRLAIGFCISRELRHPNVIQTLDLLKDGEDGFFEVMEFCPGGDLFALVRSAGRLEVQEADCFFKQLMLGVQYIHDMGVTHRDLKPENLLLTTRGRLKISDFGDSTCFRMAWETGVGMVSGIRGSRPYIAPEVYTNDSYDGRAVDVWACGIIYMTMLTGHYHWGAAKRDEDMSYTQYLNDRRQEEGFSPIEALRPCTFSFAAVTSYTAS